MVKLKLVRNVGLSAAPAPVSLAMAWSQYCHYEGVGSQLLVFAALVDKEIGQKSVSIRYDGNGASLPLSYQETPQYDPAVGVWGKHLAIAPGDPNNPIWGTFNVVMVDALGQQHADGPYVLYQEQGPLLAHGHVVNLAYASLQDGVFSGVVAAVAAPMFDSVTLWYSADGWKTVSSLPAQPAQWNQTGPHDAIASPNASGDYVWAFRQGLANVQQLQFYIEAKCSKFTTWDNNYMNNYRLSGNGTIYGNENQ